ncbi:SMC-Scp complex subunit ScpB [Parvularcula sp. LCG005]|uniref:SMC-Scp complex subunit ScpB n=1 Tax=Parvularcula sp. LCG005 TaxID=3078805 RepID=UPI002942DF7E|nr:SMC-Scp complex subunit ScpB [Parvularcula sp. LCG005]WOI52430.1 SMC-Scp complex subunit ScpB [Parvularcula sp. LCG005]
MSDANAKADDLETAERFGPREAQDRLEEAFGGDPDGDESTVVAMNGDEDIPELDNPFAQEVSAHLAKRKIEAMLFASPKPLAESFLADRVGHADVPALLAQLVEEYDDRGVNLRMVDGRWQFVTAPDVVGVLVEQRTQNRKLSRAALETLAIIAYHQPCSRADIEDVRGVAVAKGSLDQLLELGWVKLRGRREAPGRPVLYGTTSSFLEHFGLAGLNDLPGMADLKAAGLLDARLPPGFSVPTPRSDDDDENAEADALAGHAEFAGDFHDDETSVGLDSDANDAVDDANDRDFD